MRGALTKKQRYEIGVEYRNYKLEKAKYGNLKGTNARDFIAKKHGISRRSVQDFEHFAEVVDECEEMYPGSREIAFINDVLFWNFVELSKLAAVERKNAIASMFGVEREKSELCGDERGENTREYNTYYIGDLIADIARNSEAFCGQIKRLLEYRQSVIKTASDKARVAIALNRACENINDIWRDYGAEKNF